MGKHSEAFVGIDTSKLRNAIAVADGGRGGEVRYFGEFPTTDAAIRKLVAKLAEKYGALTFCYEAGPTGYGLYRLLESLGQECVVVAPSLIPKKPGDRVKTNRRDAISLAKLSRAGELTSVWGAKRAARGHARSLACSSGREEGPPGQAPADLVLDAEVGTHLSGKEDVGASPHEVADGAETPVSRAAHRIRGTA